MRSQLSLGLLAVVIAVVLGSLAFRREREREPSLDAVHASPPSASILASREAVELQALRALDSSTERSIPTTRDTDPRAVIGEPVAPTSPAPFEPEPHAPQTLDLRGTLVCPVEGVQLRGEATLRGTDVRHFLSIEHDGRFHAEVGQPGTYDLFAHVSIHDATPGTAYRGTARGELELRLDEEPATTVLALRGDGAVRGRVRGSDAQAVAGLEVLVVESSLRRGGGYDAGRADKLAREGLGGVTSWVTTDTEGRFEVTGLRPGRYEVESHHGPLTTSPVWSDGAELELRLAAAPQLVVRVVDHDGEPWSGPLDPEAAWEGHVADEWPATPGVYVAAAEPVERWQVRDDALALPGRSVGPGEVSFEVEPGGEYDVAVWGGSFAWRPQRVVVPPTGGRVDVTIASEAAEPALLTVHLAGVEDGVARSSLALRLEDLASGRPVLVQGPFLGDPWPLELAIPAGSWRLAVEGAPKHTYRGELLRNASHGRFETELGVEAGQRVAVTARVPAGARVELELLGEVQDADREAVAQHLGVRREPELTSLAARATIRLRSTERWPRPLLFPHEAIERSHGAGRARPPAPVTRLEGYLEVGTRGLSDLVPAARWVIEARLPGGRVASREVTLLAGSTSTVVLGL